MKKQIKLSSEQRRTLTSWARSNTLEHRYVERAKIILELDKGRTYSNIEIDLHTSRSNIARWKLRFEANGIDGLMDRHRSGKPRIYLEIDRVRVVKLACSKPEDGYTNWSQRRIAAKLGMSQHTVWEILNSNELKPHKVEYWCGKSTDPEFEKKMLDIVGLYLNPPTNALVLSVDEKTQIQALDRTQLVLPMRKGNGRRLTNTYKRNGVVSLIAALSVHEGEITAKKMERNTSQNFLIFLKQLDRKYRNKKLHIIVDNLSVHKNKEVKAWVASKRKIVLHYTPTYSSWLNQIEIWFGILSKDVLKGGVWKSKEQLVSQILLYIKTYNRTRARPFKWTYEGGNRTNGSLH